MPGLEPFVLSPGAKGFFENPAYLIGLPFAILGAIGVLIALLPIELRWPQREHALVQRAAVAAETRGHATVQTYLQVGAVLAVGTIMEVAVYYVDMARSLQLVFLLLLTVLDFALVALFFMHLRFDSRVFSVLFMGGLMLVMALFFVVLASLGASLV